MKLAILLGSPDISGGTNVIFEHASRLQTYGHRVSIITEEPVAPERYSWHPDAALLEWSTFEEIEGVIFDICLATWWRSIFDLHRVRARQFIYFIQSIETRFFPSSNAASFPERDIEVWAEWCHATYRYPLPAITEAHWIQAYLAEHFNSAAQLVPNGIRKDIFRSDVEPLSKPAPGRLRVLIEGPLNVFYKNVELSVELCRKAGIPEIWLLTSSDIDQYTGVDRCFSRVPIHKTAEIYGSCDVLVKLSTVEGMFGPPLEMFHCGGTAIVYAVTGHDEYMQDGLNSLVVPEDDRDAIVEALKKLQADQGLLESLKAGALETARSWPSWDDASSRFNDVLNNIELPSAEMSRTFLAEFTEYADKNRDNALRRREIDRFAEREASADGGSGKPFINHVQVYWSTSPEPGTELTGSYQSGNWDKCRITIPGFHSPAVIRVDPSVRIGIILLRFIQIVQADDQRVIWKCDSSAAWKLLGLSGTARYLRTHPYPVIEAYGEDSQIYLPELDIDNSDGDISVELEIREMSYAQAFAEFSVLSRTKTSFWQKLLFSLKQSFTI